MPSNIPSPDPLAVRSREAARLLSISERTLWSLTAPRGPIPVVRLGGAVLYVVESLRRYLAEAQGADPAASGQLRELRP